MSAAMPGSPTSLQVSAIPSSPPRNDAALQLASIRAQLKEWEKAFATAHNGKKPSRDDIKNDVSGIGKVYKEYNRVRGLVEGQPEKKSQSQNQKSHEQKKAEGHRRKPSLKRSREDLDDRNATVQPSPRKQQVAASTPRKAHTASFSYDRPPSSTTPRPLLKSFIGPTPQRDGKILGLFDLLPPSGASSNVTPSTRKRKADALNEGNANVVQTPSRKKRGDLLDHLDDVDDAANTGRRQRFEKTPASEGKKFLLSQFFATPSTTRFMPVAEEEEEAEQRTRTPLRAKLLAGREGVTMNVQPSESALDSTPTFLRRTSSLDQKFIGDSVGELSFASPEKIRRGPQRLSLFKKGRSLSELVRDLRKAQDEEYDDDMAAMNEMESGPRTSDVQASDSQVVETEGGEQPRVWKKKGQKRTTRRVNMKPPTVRKTKNSDLEEQEAEEESDDELAVAETQMTVPGQEHLDDNDFDIDLDSILEEDEEKDVGQSAPKSIGKPVKKVSTTTTEPKRKTVKANAVSHMNFRSLKIKNKNSKAKGRGFGRFGGRGRR